MALFQWMVVGYHGKLGAPAVYRATEEHRRARAAVIAPLQPMVASDAQELVPSPGNVTNNTVRQQASLVIECEYRNL